MWQLLLLPACLAFRFVPTPPASMTRASPVINWLNVSLDHFDTSNTATFPLRFYYGNNFPGENIVVFVGGEWEITPDYITGGMVYNLAEKVGAGLFYPEHRYYGETRPSMSATTEELKYLTAEQALADVAQFLRYIKSDSFENGRYKNGKVALVGCSYSASLATWMKLKYPDLVNAVFADSGPLTAQEDYYQYQEVVTESIRTIGGQECVDSIQKAIDGLLTLMATAEGRKTIDTMYNTCKPLTSNPDDINSFFWYSIVQSLARLVQNTEWEIAPSCEILTNSSVSDPVQRLANIVAPSKATERCMTSSYDIVIESNNNTSFENNRHVSGRVWTYQTCTQFGWFQSTTSEKQAFRKVAPVELFRKLCIDLFSDEFTVEYINAGVNQTNKDLGANIPDHVVSARGSLDPWGPVCAQASRAEAPVYVIEGVSHCSAIGAISNNTGELATKKRAIFEDLVRFMTA